MVYEEEMRKLEVAQAVGGPRSGKVVRQQRITAAKFGLKKESKMPLNERLARLAAEDGMSINLISQSKGLRAGMKALGHDIPLSRMTIKAKIEEFHTELKDHKKKYIKDYKPKPFSVTLDEYTSLASKRLLLSLIHI